MKDFQNPIILITILPLIGIVGYHIYQWFQIGAGFPRQELWTNHLQHNTDLWWKTALSYLRESFPYLRFIACFFVIYSASGPGIQRKFLPDQKKGIDILFALDISGSMIKSSDFLPKNRLTVSKELLQEFIDKRLSDRLGLVVFAGAAYLQSPLTNDLNALREILADMDTDTVDEQGTAIGDAILLSTYRLKSSTTKTKIIILLTDGVSNTGKIDPDTAADTARAFGIKIYSIGVGKEDGDYEVNFDSLAQISQNTGGLFYRAESPQELQSVLSEIDRLEKDILAERPKELIETDGKWALYLAIVFLFLDWGGRAFVFRYYP